MGYVTRKILLTVWLYAIGQVAFAQTPPRGMAVLGNVPTSGKRTALIIGNGNYLYGGSLKNPVNDARQMSDALRKLGFDVVSYTNINRQTFDKAVDDWGSRVKNYDVALFYFAGHGAQVDGQNYLFPVDANPRNKSDVNYVTYPVSRIVGKLDDERVKVSIVLLDACSNNPFVRSWNRDGGTGGLATISAAQGMFIGFAAMPGATASDGNRTNGLYAEGILRHIQTPNLTIDQAFNRIANYVKTTSRGVQNPFRSSSLTDDFYFVRTQPEPVVPPKVVPSAPPSVTVAPRPVVEEPIVVQPAMSPQRADLLRQANEKVAQAGSLRFKRTLRHIGSGLVIGLATTLIVYAIVNPSVVDKPEKRDPYCVAALFQRLPTNLLLRANRSLRDC